MRVRCLFPAGLPFVVCLAAPPVAAQYTTQAAAIRGVDERFRIDFGGFFQTFNTTVTIGGRNSNGTEINFEDVLGEASRHTSFRADGYWRFGPHGRVSLSYRGWTRKAEKTIDREIQIGDTTYLVGANVSSKDQVNVFELYYGYSFVNNGSAEVGLQLGISGYFYKFSFSATGNVLGPGGSVGGTTGNEAKNLIAPVPAIGGYFNYALYPRFFVFATARGLPNVTISGYSGNFVDVTAGLDYFFTQNFGIGGAYEYARLNFASSNVPNASLAYRYSGPLGYLALAF
jgi:hypothetical protein